MTSQTLYRHRDKRSVTRWEVWSKILILNDKEDIADHSGRAVWGMGLGRLVAGIVCSNPAQDMGLSASVLCCPV
jgi:hypothetical protein